MMSEDNETTFYPMFNSFYPRAPIEDALRRDGLDIPRKYTIRPNEQMLNFPPATLRRHMLLLDFLSSCKETSKSHWSYPTFSLSNICRNDIPIYHMDVVKHLAGFYPTLYFLKNYLHKYRMHRRPCYLLNDTVKFHYTLKNRLPMATDEYQEWYDSYQTRHNRRTYYVLATDIRWFLMATHIIILIIFICGNIEVMAELSRTQDFSVLFKLVGVYVSSFGLSFILRTFCDCLMWCFFLFLFHPSVRPFVAFINGSHGEFTGTDDLDQADRKRNHKEAKNRLFAKGFKKSKVRHGPPTEVDIITEVIEEHLSEEPEVKKITHLTQTVGSWTLCYSRKLGLYTNQLEECNYVYINMLNLPCYGDFNKEDSFVEGVKEYLLLDILYEKDFIAFSKTFTARGLVYSPFVVKDLLKEMPAPSEDLRNFRALQAFVVKRYENVPLELLVNSIIAYLATLVRLTPHLNAPLTVHENFVPVKTHLFTRQKVEIKPSSCKIPNDWAFNTRFKIIAQGGAKVEVGFIPDTDFIAPFYDYPTFSKGTQAQEKYKNVAYCKLPPSTDFEYYDINAHNCTPALSRLLKARANEGELFRNQLGLLNPEWNSLYEIADCKFVDLGEKQSLVTRNHNDCFGKYVFEKHENYEFVHYVMQHKCADNNRTSYSILMKRMLSVLTYGLAMFEKVIRGFTMITQFALASVVFVAFSPLYMFYDSLEWLSFVVELPSLKRKLYQMWFNDENTRDRILANKGNFELKIKKEEGKFGKAPRLYGSGEHLCLVDRVLPDVIKQMEKEDIDLNELYTQFNPEREDDFEDWSFKIRFSIAQDAPSSDDLYNEGFNLEPKSVLFVYFSDDSFLVMKDELGCISLFEIDISSCDSSNSIAVFGFTHQRMASINPESADRLISHATRQAVLYNPENKTEKFIFIPDTFFEYSGLLITGLLNNDGSTLIGIGTFLKFIQGHGMHKAITEGAKKMGYIVTCDKFESSNQVTFLKRAYSERAQRSWKVLGTLFRGFGVVEGDLTPEVLNVDRKTFMKLNDFDKFEKLCYCRLLGEVNEPGNPCLNILRERFGIPTTLELVSTLDFQERYGGEVWEWESFYMQLSQLQLGSILKHPILDLIYLKDYGVKLPP
jgi:hypothetical protein